MQLLSDSGRLSTFMGPSISYRVCYVKGAFDSEMTNSNFLGSLDRLGVLRECVWEKQTSPHFYTKVKSVPVGAGFTDDCSGDCAKARGTRRSRLLPHFWDPEVFEEQP